MAKDSANGPGSNRSSCPICKAPAAETWRPFCSRRCADLDLGRWLTGAYAVPAEDDDPFDPGDPED